MWKKNVYERKNEIFRIIIVTHDLMLIFIVSASQQQKIFFNLSCVVIIVRNSDIIIFKTLYSLWKSIGIRHTFVWGRNQMKIHHTHSHAIKVPVQWKSLKHSIFIELGTHENDEKKKYNKCICCVFLILCFCFAIGWISL